MIYARLSISVLFLGTPGHTSLETVTFEVEKIKKSLWQDEQSGMVQDGEDKSGFGLQIHTTFRRLLSAVNTATLDVRLVGLLLLFNGIIIIIIIN